MSSLKDRFKKLQRLHEEKPRQSDVVVSAKSEKHVVLKAPTPMPKGRRGKAVPVWLLDGDQAHLAELSKFLHNKHKLINNSTILRAGLHRLKVDEATLEWFKEFEKQGRGEGGGL